MTSIQEVLLELECLQEDLHLLPLEVVSPTQCISLLRKLADITTMTLKATTNVDSLVNLEETDNGDMI